VATPRTQSQVRLTTSQLVNYIDYILVSSKRGQPQRMCTLKPPAVRQWQGLLTHVLLAGGWCCAAVEWLSRGNTKDPVTGGAVAGVMLHVFALFWLRGVGGGGLPFRSGCYWATPRTQSQVGH
jgi:hypothetical protein